MADGRDQGLDPMQQLHAQLDAVLANVEQFQAQLDPNYAMVSESELAQRMDDFEPSAASDVMPRATRYMARIGDGPGAERVELDEVHKLINELDVDTSSNSMPSRVFGPTDVEGLVRFYQDKVVAAAVDEVRDSTAELTTPKVIRSMGSDWSAARDELLASLRLLQQPNTSVAAAAAGGQVADQVARIGLAADAAATSASSAPRLQYNPSDLERAGGNELEAALSNQSQNGPVSLPDQGPFAAHYAKALDAWSNHRSGLSLGSFLAEADKAQQEQGDPSYGRVRSLFRLLQAQTRRVRADRAFADAYRRRSADLERFLAAGTLTFLEDGLRERVRQSSLDRRSHARSGMAMPDRLQSEHIQAFCVAQYRCDDMWALLYTAIRCREWELAERIVQECIRTARERANLQPVLGSLRALHRIHQQWEALAWSSDMQRLGAASQLQDPSDQQFFTACAQHYNEALRQGSHGPDYRHKLAVLNLLGLCDPTGAEEPELEEGEPDLQDDPEEFLWMRLMFVLAQPIHDDIHRQRYPEASPCTLANVAASLVGRGGGWQQYDADHAEPLEYAFLCIACQQYEAAAAYVWGHAKRLDSRGVGIHHAAHLAVVLYRLGLLRTIDRDLLVEDTLKTAYDLETIFRRSDPGDGELLVRGEPKSGSHRAASQTLAADVTQEHAEEVEEARQQERPAPAPLTDEDLRAVFTVNMLDLRTLLRDYIGLALVLPAAAGASQQQLPDGFREQLTRAALYCAMLTDRLDLESKLELLRDLLLAFGHGGQDALLGPFSRLHFDGRPLQDLLGSGSDGREALRQVLHGAGRQCAERGRFEEAFRLYCGSEQASLASEVLLQQLCSCLDPRNGQRRVWNEFAKQWLRADLHQGGPGGARFDETVRAVELVTNTLMRFFDLHSQAKYEAAMKALDQYRVREGGDGGVLPRDAGQPWTGFQALHPRVKQVIGWVVLAAVDCLRHVAAKHRSRQDLPSAGVAERRASHLASLGHADLRHFINPEVARAISSRR